MAAPEYLQENLPDNLNAFLARVNENSRKSDEENEAQTAARMAIGVALEKPQRKGKEDFYKIIAANAKFVVQQNETNTQLENLTRQQEMSETNITNFQQQMSVLATSITNIGKKQDSDNKTIMETMKSFSTQLLEMKAEIANINNNSSLSSTFPPYP